jgi:hypothetical protein
MPLRVPKKARVWKNLHTTHARYFTYGNTKEQRAHRQNHYTQKKFGNDCRNLQTVESKVAHTTGLAKPATRADHS